MPTPWEPCSDSCFGYLCGFWAPYGHTFDGLVAQGCNNCDGCEACSDDDDGGGGSYGYGYGDDDGPDCTHLDDGATDPFGDGCDAYAQVPGWCGLYDSDVFGSEEVCCGCGGGLGGCTDWGGGATDNYGDGCDDYAENLDWCGLHNNGVFSSDEMCCACGGGGSYSYSYVYEYDNGDGDYPGCTSSDDGAADTYGAGCGDYAANRDWCGKYDSEEFTSDDMCCACPNGGSCAPSAMPPTAAVPTTPSPSPEGTTPPPTACFEDCLGVVAASGCRAALQGSCFGNCNEAAFTAGTWAYSCFAGDCFFATYDDDDGANPFVYFPCPAQAVVSTSIGTSGLD